MGWKIVRDNNEAWCRVHGVSGTWRVAGDAEAAQALMRKLGEEYLEFVEQGNPAELLDMRDALTELLALLDPEGRLEAVHQAKVAEHGLFREHIMWSPFPAEPVPARAYLGTKEGR